METWGFAISFAISQPGNRSVEGLIRGHLERAITPSSVLLHWQLAFKVLPVLTST